jgi:hypothetical protein
MAPPLPSEKKPRFSFTVFFLLLLILWLCIMPCSMLPGPAIRRALGLAEGAPRKRSAAAAAQLAGGAAPLPTAAPALGPEVAAIYVFYRRPKSFHHAVRAFRTAYPASTLVMVCDDGCFDYSAAAKRVGAVYKGQPHRLSMKKHGAFYVGPDEALNVIRAYRDAVNLIKEPYYVQLEDDVYVLQRIKTPLLGNINGMARDKSIVGGAEEYIVRHVPNPPYLYLGGFGGCVYETAFWKRILNLPTIEDEVRDLYAKADNYGVDYIMSSLLWRFNGTMYDWPGYIENFREESQERLARGEIEVLHGYKHLYGKGKGTLTWEEREFLGPGFDKGKEGEE